MKGIALAVLVSSISMLVIHIGVSQVHTASDSLATSDTTSQGDQQKRTKLTDTLPAISNTRLNEMIRNVLDSVRTNKVVYLGLSIGYRYILNDYLDRDYAISTVDSTLTASPIDRKNFVLGGSVAVFPFKNSDPESLWTVLGWPPLRLLIRSIGFVAKLNIAEFNAQSITTKTTSIEGGLGFGLRLHESFALSFTWENIFQRKARPGIEVGKRVVLEGKTLTQVNPDDDRFFFKHNFIAWTLSMIFLF